MNATLHKTKGCREASVIREFLDWQGAKVTVNDLGHPNRIVRAFPELRGRPRPIVIIGDEKAVGFTELLHLWSEEGLWRS